MVVLRFNPQCQKGKPPQYLAIVIEGRQITRFEEGVDAIGVHHRGGGRPRHHRVVAALHGSFQGFGPVDLPVSQADPVDQQVLLPRPVDGGDEGRFPPDNWRGLPVSRNGNLPGDSPFRGPAQRKISRWGGTGTISPETSPDRVGRRRGRGGAGPECGQPGHQWQDQMHFSYFLFP